MSDIAGSSSIFQLVYCSTAVRLFREHELTELLRQSRARNGIEDVTGLLLYYEGGFIQVLEGPEAAVRKVFASITKDPRHYDVTTILSGPTAHREFRDWQMAFRRLDSHRGEFDGYSQFLNSPLNEPEFSKPSRCRRLLVDLKRTFR